MFIVADRSADRTRLGPRQGRCLGVAATTGHVAITGGYRLASAPARSIRFGGHRPGHIDSTNQGEVKRIMAAMIALVVFRSGTI